MTRQLLSWPAPGWPTPDELLLLRAALLDGHAARAAWRQFCAARGGIDGLEGDAVGLLPQLFCNLRGCDPDDPALGRLRGTYRRAWYANELLLDAGAKAVAALQAGGLEVMLIGGGALVALGVCDVGARPIDAIDILIDSRDRRRARATLRALGWMTAGQAPWRPWRRVQPMTRNGVRLRVHTGGLSLQVQDTELWARSITVRVHGIDTLVPSPTDQLRIAIALRRDQAPGPLCWIPDAVHLIRSSPSPEDWSSLLAPAQLGHAGAEIADALRYLAAAGLAPELAVRPSSSLPARLDAGRVQAFRQLSLDSALAELVRLLEPRGVRPLLLKGPAFAHWLYDDPRERRYDDIDVLVAPHDYDTARRGLAELGFEQVSRHLHPSEGARHHEEWIRPGALPVEIELHHTLRMVPAPAALVWRRMSADAHQVVVGGTPVDVPSEPVSALIVALHAAQHAGGHRRPMSDLEQALARVDDHTWRAAAALAQELGAAPAFAAGVRLESAGRDLAGRLALRDDTPRYIRLRATNADRRALSIEKLVDAHGVSARLGVVADQLFPSREAMRGSSPLARRGRFGLTLAYFRRLGLLPVTLPVAITAWLRGTR